MMIRFFVIFFLTISYVNAQVIATDRPSAQTDNSYSLYHKCFQIESGLLYLHENGIVQPSSLPNLLLRYGLLDKLELRFSSDLLFSLDDNTFSKGSINFGTKLQLIREENFQLAFLSMASIENNTQEIMTKIVGANPITENLTLGYTLGYQSASNFYDKTLNYSLFLSNSFGNKFSGFLELYGDWKYNNIDFSYQINFDFGCSYLLSEVMQLDTYFGKGIQNDMYFASLGFSYLFIK